MRLPYTPHKTDRRIEQNRRGVSSAMNVLESIECAVKIVCLIVIALASIYVAVKTAEIGEDVAKLRSDVFEIKLESNGR